ncbi:hypothetical protein Btru_011923 [Bulinus truncatus]|nr:hypothetical protein Btru_011923 [Bulinus truncatus]
MSWGNRTEDSPDKPRIFCTAKWHMFEIYKYLGNEMKPRECQALFHEYPVIFVPIPEQNVKGGDMLAGWMMKRDEVWWSDPTGLFTKYMKSLVTYNSPLGKFKILSDTYSHLEDFFSKTARIDQEPSTMHYAQLLKHIATVCSLAEEGVLYDTMCLFTKIGNDLSKISSIVAHVKTIEAMKAESNLPEVTELLSKSAVFPTKSGQWVSLSDSPMISDSKEYEEMFSKKPGVHLLRLDVQDNTGNIDPKCVDYFIHLFKEIKPLSECIKTEEITSLFKQCNKGQTYLHNIVGPVQRYLYSAFPGVYRQFKAKKSGSLKELIFSQVERLQVRYDLAHLPDVFVIKEERCVVTDKCFYFHEKFVDNHFEINKELARYFSEGDEKCMRELRNFLIEADFIFENKSKGTIEDLLNSLTSSNSTLPHDEEVWEVPLPIIPVTPEPEPTFMVYDQQASSSENFIPFKPEEQESQGLKSWPPKSAVDKEEGNRIKRDPNKAPSLWPPPQGASGPRNVSKLPSNIKFENPPSEIELSTGDDTKSPRDDSHVPYESKGGQGTSRQSSQSNEERHVTGHLTTRQVSHDHEGKRISRAEQGQQEGDQPKQSNSEESSSLGHHKGDRLSWGGPATVSGSDPKSANDANQELSQSGDMLSRNDSNGERENVMTGERRRKRKLTGNSQDDNFIALKRVNSQEEPVQEHQSQEDHVTDANRDASPSEGSGREATPSRTNEEQKKSTKHRGMLHFTIPNWNEYNEDLLYSELAHAESLTLPQLTLQQGAQEKEIGLWGEQLVFNYLQHQRESNSNMHSVIWVNATGEMGLPFDFEIVYKTPDPEKTTSLYVEVKTTVSKDKEVFHVSSNQMEFALAQKSQYEIYRVYGAGSPTARLVRIENVSEKMRVKQIQLFMVI